MLLKGLHRPLSHRQITATSQITLNRAQRPLERARQRAHRRHLLALLDELPITAAMFPRHANNSSTARSVGTTPPRGLAGGPSDAIHRHIVLSATPHAAAASPTRRRLSGADFCAAQPLDNAAAQLRLQTAEDLTHLTLPSSVAAGADKPQPPSLDDPCFKGKRHTYQLPYRWQPSHEILLHPRPIRVRRAP